MISSRASRSAHDGIAARVHDTGNQCDQPRRTLLQKSGRSVRSGDKAAGEFTLRLDMTSQGT